ncbi:tetratricopeptide TPR_2 [Thecamonas trahens ATCC 50062]|uniref:Tetratricopeptide TPR_2 n=1 Tax=Thecamonas trahens ATCC 50062 TaxID=461836 RepID=A0A0L0DI27_THETB|nr:tetratricopeptide TPR_2 [Thecamonas trahens ATCC 50062]KNC51957.1 tetratricopeptide TPR_2 [Thecamonas trahens ATCC 50062]|eukprot:XP_013755544.1 tetratricopeptide TPR_2 [Thecamonas trahens ATCC 50062]
MQLARSESDALLTHLNGSSSLGRFGIGSLLDDELQLLSPTHRSAFHRAADAACSGSLTVAAVNLSALVKALPHSLVLRLAAANVALANGLLPLTLAHLDAALELTDDPHAVGPGLLAPASPASGLAPDSLALVRLPRIYAALAAELGPQPEILFYMANTAKLAGDLAGFLAWLRLLAHADPHFLERHVAGHHWSAFDAASGRQACRCTPRTFGVAYLAFLDHVIAHTDPHALAALTWNLHAVHHLLAANRVDDAARSLAAVDDLISDDPPRDLAILLQAAHAALAVARYDRPTAALAADAIAALSGVAPDEYAPQPELPPIGRPAHLATRKGVTAFALVPARVAALADHAKAAATIELMVNTAVHTTRAVVHVAQAAALVLAGASARARLALAAALSAVPQRHDALLLWARLHLIDDCVAAALPVLARVAGIIHEPEPQPQPEPQPESQQSDARATADFLAVLASIQAGDACSAYHTLQLLHKRQPSWRLPQSARISQLAAKLPAVPLAALGDALYARGCWFEETTGDASQAFVDMARALDVHPTPERYLHAARLLLRIDAPRESAAALLTSAIDLEPHSANVEALYLRGHLYSISGPAKRVAAIADFSAALEASPRHVHALHARARLYLEASDIDAAINDLLVARQVHLGRDPGSPILPGTAKALLLLATLLIKVDAADEALKVLIDAAHLPHLPVNDHIAILVTSAKCHLAVATDDDLDAIDVAVSDASHALELLDMLGAPAGDRERCRALFTRARAYAVASRERDALVDLTAVALANPSFPLVYVVLGNTALALGMIDEAMSYFDAALARKPDEVAALYQRARLHAAAGRYRLAQRDLTRALISAPDHADHGALFLRACVADNLGQHAAALADVNQIIDADWAPHLPRATLYAARARMLFNLGEFEPAIAATKAVLAMTPGDTATDALLGLALFRGGNTATGLAHLQSLVEREPTAGDAHLYLSFCLDELSRDDEALAAYTAADATITDDDTKCELLANMGSLLASRGQLDAATAVLDRLLDRAVAVDGTTRAGLPRATLARALATRASVWLARGDVDAAANDIAAAAHHAPLDPDVLNTRALVLIQRGDTTGALDLLVTARESTDPDSSLAVTATYNTGLVLLLQSRPGAALEVLDTLVEDQTIGDSGLLAAVHTNRAQCMLLLGETSAAITALDAALQINPRYPPALIGRAIVALQTRQLGHAAATASRAAAALRGQPESSATSALPLAGLGSSTDVLNRSAAVASLGPARSLSMTDQVEALEAVIATWRRFYDVVFADFERAAKVNPRHADLDRTRLTLHTQWRFLAPPPPSGTEAHTVYLAELAHINMVIHGRDGDAPHNFPRWRLFLIRAAVLQALGLFSESESDLFYAQTMLGADRVPPGLYLLRARALHVRGRMMEAGDAIMLALACWRSSATVLCFDPEASAGELEAHSARTRAELAWYGAVLVASETKIGDVAGYDLAVQLIDTALDGLPEARLVLLCNKVALAQQHAHVDVALEAYLALLRAMIDEETPGSALADAHIALADVFDAYLVLVEHLEALAGFERETTLDTFGPGTLDATLDALFAAQRVVDAAIHQLHRALDYDVWYTDEVAAAETAACHAQFQARATAYSHFLAHAPREHIEASVIRGDSELETAVKAALTTVIATMHKTARDGWRQKSPSHSPMCG